MPCRLLSLFSEFEATSVYLLLWHHDIWWISQTTLQLSQSIRVINIDKSVHTQLDSVWLSNQANVYLSILLSIINIVSKITIHNNAKKLSTAVLVRWIWGYFSPLAVTHFSRNKLFSTPCCWCTLALAASWHGSDMIGPLLNLLF